MMKLFHNLRKNQLTQGKTMNYLKYATGEILLVVIGILIALSINNWNDGRKGKKFEQEILSLIDQNLERDSVLICIELIKNKRAMDLTDRLLEQVANKNYKNDSLNLWMGEIICFERFKSQSSAFEVLKAKGIETISNKRLQIELISYYDESLYKLYESLKDVENSFNNDWIPVVKQDFSDFKWRDHCQPNDTKNFFEKPSTIVLFKIYKDNRDGSFGNMQGALNKISELRTLIKNDLHD
ncbi:MAG: DUF6090 family protein [Maribacter sp.]|nr:DUF6090 family protein [Maribacter sp.]